MEITTATVWWGGCALALLFGIIAGYVVGVRLSRKRQRTLVQSLKDTNLELLEVRMENREMSRFLGDAQRKDRLLTLALKKLKTGNLAVHELQRSQQDIDRKHFIEKSRLNLTAVEAKQKAKQAAEVAREASSRLRILEEAMPQLQTIEAHEPKSYGQGEAVTVSVVDKHDSAATVEHANQVSNRDLHRLSSMQPSNEKVLSPPDNTVSFSNTAPKSALTAAHDEAGDEQSEQSLHKNETVNRAN